MKRVLLYGTEGLHFGTVIEVENKFPKKVHRGVVYGNLVGYDNGESETLESLNKKVKENKTDIYLIRNNVCTGITRCGIAM